MKSPGFTLLESVIVLAIVAVILVLTIPLTQRFHVVSLLDDEAKLLATDLRRARAAAVAGVGDTAHGLHLEATPADRWTLFRGAAYSEGAPANEVHTLRSSVDITAVALSGGGADIVFAERRGTTTRPGSITLRASNGDTRTVTVNSQGTIEVQ